MGQVAAGLLVVDFRGKNLYPSLPKDSKSEVVITSSEFSERPHFLGLLDRLISRGEGSPWTSSFMNGRVDLNNFYVKMPALKADDKKPEFIEVPVRILWK